MTGSMFFLLFGETIMTLLVALSGSLRNIAIDSTVDPDDTTFIESIDFMLPENFVARYPLEINSSRLKIYAYLIFNLLVKGYGSIDPGSFWTDYNRDDFYRTAIDAVFHEHLTNFADGESKDFPLDSLESTRNNLPVSNEKIAVDRIGRYLDHLSATESQPDRLKRVYDILSKKNESPAVSNSRRGGCKRKTKIQTSGKPGIDYPNFCDIPETSFSCDSNRIPGIYPDYETGCQVFHVCWPHRIDSFLCPIGTTFNQSLLTCDFWHDTGCYTSPLFPIDNQFIIDGISTERDIPEFDGSCESLLNKPLRLHTMFLPAKCKVVCLKDGKQTETKYHENDAEDLEERLETAYKLVKEMLGILVEIRDELDAEMKDRETPWIHALAKSSESKPVPESSTEAVSETIEFIRKIGESDFKQTDVTERLNHSGKFSPGAKPDLPVKSSTSLEISKSLEAHIKSQRKQDVPEIVSRSLGLGGNILSEGVIPFTKQLIMDSYRKIKSKKH